MKNFQMTFITSTTTNRWLKLLNLLERHKTLSNRELSKAVQSSRRTIIYDMEGLRSYFGSTLMIESTSNGYSLHELLPKEYLERKRALLQNEPLFVILSICLRENIGQSPNGQTIFIFLRVPFYAI